MKTLREAVELYVDKLNEFPLDMIKQMMKDHSEDWKEVTEVEDGEDFLTELPMWGFMWQFSNGCDHYWMEEEDGISIMSKLGFRIYEHREWGYFFGIDSAGHNFYDAYWTPLYKARGLCWHSANLEAIEGAVANMEYCDGDIHIDSDGRYFLDVNYEINDINGDFVDMMCLHSEIRDDRTLAEIVEALESDFESYEYTTISDEEMEVLRDCFYDNYITELKKELGIE